jgi:hypothetical protein
MDWVLAPALAFLVGVFLWYYGGEIAELVREARRG